MVNNSNEIAENLIIIGNGFDLSSGLQSTFSDFMKYRMPNGDDNFSELLSSFQESNSNINDIVQKFQTDEEKIIVFNFWEYLLLLKKFLTNKSNWSDIEGLIKDFFTNKKYDEDDPTFEEFLNPEFSNYSYDMDSFMILGRSFSDYSILINKLVATYQDAEYKKLINDGSFPWSKFIRSELNQFEKSFGNYLRLKIEESKTYENESKNLIQKLSNNKPYNLLSFNYTNPVKNSKNLVNFRNIHGDLDNPILGIDSTSIKPTDEAFTYTKTYRIMDNSENKSDPILTHNIKEIVIFGHSLNDSDFSYFDSIFDYYNIYDSDIRLVFAYKIYSDDEENIASDHYLAVSNLLYKYGETFDNKSHGRNLMHKMLIEKRLELREIKD